MPTTPESRIKIQVNNLTKRFGDLTVLDGINFNIKEGELLAIVGPTGCGKTTFLNTLSKLMPATEGEILIDGEEANPKKHNISYVFQEPTCLPWRTVRENVAFGMEVKGVGKEEREARATQIMDLVGLSSCADLYPNQVSASMMQRIAVSRAFAVNPDLLLMDEPYGQLAVKLRFYLEDELVNIWKKLNSTLLFVTHDPAKAEYADQVIHIIDGKVAKRETHGPAEISAEEIIQAELGIQRCQPHLLRICAERRSGSTAKANTGA